MYHVIYFILLVIVWYVYILQNDSMKDDLKDRQKSTHTHTQNFVNYHRNF